MDNLVEDMSFDLDETDSEMSSLGGDNDEYEGLSDDSVMDYEASDQVGGSLYTLEKINERQIPKFGILGRDYRLSVHGLNRGELTSFHLAIEQMHHIIVGKFKLMILLSISHVQNSFNAINYGSTITLEYHISY